MSLPHAGVVDRGANREVAPGSGSARRVRRVLGGLSAILVAVLVTLWILAGHGLPAQEEPGEMGSWQAGVPDDTRIAALSIPGTHDTMTYAGGTAWWLTRPYSRTQTRDLDSQLRAGIRYLDIRVRNDGRLAHGWVPVAGTLSEVFDTVESFLTAQPDEFLLLRLRDEQRSDHDAFREAVRPVLENAVDRLWVPEDERAELGEARGKIIVLRDVLGTLGSQLDELTVPFWTSDLRIQDDFQSPGVEAKFAAIRALLAAPAEPGLRFNHVSATAASCTPRCYAAELNPRLEAELRRDAAALAGGAGILILDFPSDSLIRSIIDLNAVGGEARPGAEGAEGE